MHVLFRPWKQLAALLLLVAVSACSKAGPPPITAKSMPAGGTFTGVWHSPQYGEMHMRQSGSAVIGKYTKDERQGRIQGHVTGDLMRFEWKEKRELIAGRSVTTKGHGYFRIVHDESEGTWKLIGEWGNDAAETGGGPWNAVKSPKAKVQLGGEDGDDGDDASSGSEEEEAEDDYSGKDVEGDLDSL